MAEPKNTKKAGAKKKKETPASAAKTAEVIDRRTKVWELRKAGLSLRQISVELTKRDKDSGGDGRGFSPENIRKDFDAVVAQKVKDQKEGIAGMQALASERLDDVILHIRPLMVEKVTAHSPVEVVKAKLDAAKVITKAVKEWAEIHGIKAAQKIELTGKDGKPIETVQVTMEDWKRQQAARRAQAQETADKFETE